MCRSRSALAVAAVATAFFCGAALAQSSVDYRNRGNRFEGVRALPVSGYTIELVSFRAAYDEPPPASMPALYRMRFFLEKPAPAYVVVREVRNIHSYWLDKVKPKTPWGPGFANSFEWSTRDVIDQLPGLKLDDLGVTVRVGTEHPSDLETIAPVILYHSARRQRRRTGTCAQDRSDVVLRSPIAGDVGCIQSGGRRVPAAGAGASPRKQSNVR